MKMKELLALLPESRRRLLLFLCEHRDEFRLRLQIEKDKDFD